LQTAVGCDGRYTHQQGRLVDIGPRSIRSILGTLTRLLAFRLQTSRSYDSVVMAWSPAGVSTPGVARRLPADCTTASDRRSTPAAKLPRQRKSCERFPADDAALRAAGGSVTISKPQTDATRRERMKGPIARCRANRRSPNNVERVVGPARLLGVCSKQANRKALVSLASDKQR
jgi:hypothetical protein